MATTCSTILTRAAQYSTANKGLTGDTQEMMRRLVFAQNRVMDRLASLNRFYYATTVTATSTAGASGRSIVLTPGVTNGLPNGALPVGRLLKLTLPSGTELNQVDVQDLNAELAPRYYPMGKRLYEVNSEWDASSANAVVLTLVYVQRAALIVETADPNTTNVTLDDEFTDLLELDLAAYLAHKDLGRPPDEIARLEGAWESRFQDLLAYVDGIAGVSHHRFIIPSPSQDRKE